MYIQPWIFCTKYNSTIELSVFKPNSCIHISTQMKTLITYAVVHLKAGRQQKSKILAIKNDSMAPFEHFWRPLPLIYSLVFETQYLCIYVSN